MKRHEMSFEDENWTVTDHGPGRLGHGLHLKCDAWNHKGETYTVSYNARMAGQSANILSVRITQDGRSAPLSQTERNALHEGWRERARKAAEVVS